MTQRPKPHSTPATSATGDRRSFQVAAEIVADIEAAGWPAGVNLGAEPVLCERYRVSRSVLRQAIRLLEHHQLAHMRVGRNGGLIVLEPDARSVGLAAAIFLRRVGVDPQSLGEVRQALELLCVKLAAERIDDEGRAVLRAQLEQEKAAGPGTLRTLGADFHRTIARAAGNPTLTLFSEILVTLTQQTIRAPSDDAAIEGMTRAHAKVAEAVIAGDAELAELRMKRHIEGMRRSWGPDVSTFRNLGSTIFTVAQSAIDC